MKLLHAIREILIVVVWATVVIVFLLYLMWMLSMIADCAQLM